jgi:hypothetical protein
VRDLSREDFFLNGKSLRVTFKRDRRHEEESGRSRGREAARRRGSGFAFPTPRSREFVHFKTWAERLDNFTYLIRTQGIYRGSTIASYRLPTKLGPLDELYSVVGEHFETIVKNIIKIDFS